MTYTLNHPQATAFSSVDPGDPQEMILSLMVSLNADLMQLRSERLETLTALGREPDPDHFQLIAEALDAIDFEIDQTHLELQQLYSRVETQ